MIAQALDPTSLSRLHDIVSPAPVSWWPLAPGWYVVGSAALILLFWCAWRLATWWRRNAYRREALRLLNSLPIDPSSLPKIDELLKRVALSAWPREQVAALNGAAWLAFLDRTAPETRFDKGPGRVLGEASYLPTAPHVDVRDVLDAAEAWVRLHKVKPSC
jgi:hypothetical protein